MNKPVKFELAKLLKEKGFDGNTYYSPIVCSLLYYKLDSSLTTSTHFYETQERVKAPTIAEVIMWLYEKHGIWIANNWQSGSKTFLYELIDLNSYENTILIQEKNYKDVGEVEFKTPSEAYEAAIEYTLNNLI